MEPTTTAASGFALSKGLSAMAGLFGALSVSFFWRPKAFHEHGKLVAGALIGGIGVGAAVALGGIIIKYFGMDAQSADVALGVGYLVGVMSVGVIGLLANFFKARENKDILEVAQEVRAAPQPKPAAKKAPAKKARAVK